MMKNFLMVQLGLRFKVQSQEFRKLQTCWGSQPLRSLQQWMYVWSCSVQWERCKPHDVKPILILISEAALWPAWRNTERYLLMMGHNCHDWGTVNNPHFTFDIQFSRSGLLLNLRLHLIHYPCSLYCVFALHVYNSHILFKHYSKYPPTDVFLRWYNKTVCVSSGLDSYSVIKIPESTDMQIFHIKFYCSTQEASYFTFELRM